MCLMKIISRIKSACCNSIKPVPEFTFSAAKSLYFESGQQTHAFNQVFVIKFCVYICIGPFFIHEGLLSLVLKLALSFASRLNVSTSATIKYRGTLNLVDYLTNLDTTLTYHVSEVTVN